MDHPRIFLIDLCFLFSITFTYLSKSLSSLEISLCNDLNFFLEFSLSDGPFAIYRIRTVFATSSQTSCHLLFDIQCAMKSCPYFPDLFWNLSSVVMQQMTEHARFPSMIITNPKMPQTTPKLLPLHCIKSLRCHRQIQRDCSFNGLCFRRLYQFLKEPHELGKHSISWQVETVIKFDN